MKAILLAAIWAYSALATPDCYDFTVTKLNRKYMEVVPLFLYYNQVDWMTIQANSNCGFYTYGDVLFKSYSPDVTGIYFVFNKAPNLLCNLNNLANTFNN